MYRLFPILLLFCLAACSDRTEGCLDVEAVNFDVEADDDCCCEYPGLIINFANRYADTGTVAFNYGAVYANGADTFSVTRLRFVLSDFRLVRADGTEVGITDTIFVNGAAATDDVLTIEDSRPINTIGGFREPGDYTALRFRLGLLPPFDESRPADYDEGYVLADSSLYDFDADAWRYIRARVVTDTTAAGTDSVRVFSAFVGQTYEVADTFSVARGFDVERMVRIDYRALLSGIDFEVDTPEGVAAQIAANLPNVFLREE